MAGVLAVVLALLAPQVLALIQVQMGSPSWPSWIVFSSLVQLWPARQRRVLSEYWAWWLVDSITFTATSSFESSNLSVASMFRPVNLRAILPRTRIPRAISNFSSSPVVTADHPNEALDLDPSFRALLRDVDISLLKQKQNPHATVSHSRPASRELEAFPAELDEGVDVVGGDVLEDLGEEDDHAGPRDARKSPAALFGSQSIGQVVLPLELQNSINLLIAGDPKHFI
jgi:hypothetical protein